MYSDKYFNVFLIGIIGERLKKIIFVELWIIDLLFELIKDIIL